MNDKKKYEKARKLKNCIDTIRDNYMELLNNENTKKR
jgi:DNA topoisomerase-1